MVVHGGGDAPELIEADRVGHLLRGTAGDERHRVHVEWEVVADDGDHLAAVLLPE